MSRSILAVIPGHKQRFEFAIAPGIDVPVMTGKLGYVSMLFSFWNLEGGVLL